MTVLSNVSQAGGHWILNWVWGIHMLATGGRPWFLATLTWPSAAEHRPYMAAGFPRAEEVGAAWPQQSHTGTLRGLATTHPRG